jgi:hypothetical protein
LQYRSPARDSSRGMPVPTNDELQVTEMLMPAVMARAVQDQAIRGSGARKP